MITGSHKSSVNVSTGFSYIEILISFLILSSGVLACGLLIARVQLTQIQVTQTLAAELMAGYMRTQLVLHLENSRSVEVGIFYADHRLLEGYRASGFDIDNGNPLGCIVFDSSLWIYSIDIFFPHTRGSPPVTADCDDYSVQAKTSYRVLLVENIGGAGE